MLTSLVIILASITSISTASESIKMSIKEQAYNEYGQHSVVVLNSNDTKNSIANNSDVKKIGEIKLFGTAELPNGHIGTVGEMDNHAIDIGKITLIEGSLPKEKNEVAIESTYLSLIDSTWRINEKRALKINGTITEYVLTGIVENYSARWTVPYDVQKGINDFPNIFIPIKNDKDVKYRNYLIQLKGNYGSIDKMHKKSSEFLESYSGYFNQRLFYNGLANYKHITILSIIFQVVILLATFLCMYCLLYFFNTTQNRKLAILKAIGSTNLNLLKINISQILYLLFWGVLVSLPFQYFLHVWIIQNTFNISNLKVSNALYVFIIVILWTSVIFGVTFISSYLSINRLKKNSINEMLKDLQYKKKKSTKLSIKSNEFTINKILHQLQTYPKHSVLLVSIITLSILTLSVSIFVEKESSGIWDTEIDYYLNSQEVYASKEIDNLTVLFQEGLTFSLNEVKQVEDKSGIKYVEKTPFMIDVHPMIQENLVTPSIQEWINQNGINNHTYEHGYLIPNVRYVLLNKKEFMQLYPNLNYEDLLNKVILYNPIHSVSNEGKLNGEKITFVQKKRDISGYLTNQWEFEILAMNNTPFVLRYDSLQIEYSEFTVVIAEETAVEKKMFPGFNELSIYLKDEINNKETVEIQSKLDKLIAIRPGSLYQNISNVIEKDRRISYFVGHLGKLTYSTSVLLSILSIVVLVFSKYKIMRKEWGIYLSLGMKKKELYQLLFFEMVLYLILGTIAALVLFSLTQFLDNIYPYFYYLQYFILTILIVLLWITIGWFIVVRLVKHQSIYSLIREEE